MSALTPYRLWGAGLLVLSVAYYALYLTAGFNYADDGNYAQICYELLLGRDLHDIAVGYGLLWFKAGEGLFRLFGVHFLLVKVLFFACITVTTLMLYALLARVSGRPALAAVASLVVLLAPAFPATAFYGLCIVMNAAAQVRFAMRFAEADSRDLRLDAAFAGAVLALSFQIRADFGFIFAGPLVALVALTGRRFKDSGRAAVIGFVAASLPFFICAAIGGYADLLLDQYAVYPGWLVEYGLAGMRGLFHNGGTYGDHGAILGLRRPGLATLAGGNGLAWMVYLPVLGIAAFTAFILATLPARWRTRRFGDIGLSLVGLTAGLAAFPHYFLFRPDLSHVANFMPGYLAMAGIFAVQVWREADKGWRKGMAIACATFLTAHLAAYAWIGTRSNETGSIGVARGRTQTFDAGNGVHARLAPVEKFQLIALGDAIENVTRPGDAIVCVPYCPGIAFMTGRRMLFSNFYVDDSFLARDPGWLDKAIALTREKRPGVVIVMDWAVNGTARSVFANWAAPYMSVVREISQPPLNFPGAAIYVLKPAA